MTDHRSPLDAALDLVLYAPVGLALTLTEELPKLAAKGRSGLGSRVTTARVVGQFAVAQGRKEVGRRLGTEPARPAAAPARPAAAPSRLEAAAADGSAVAAAGSATPPAATSAAAPASSPERHAGPSAPAAGADGAGGEEHAASGRARRTASSPRAGRPSNGVEAPDGAASGSGAAAPAAEVPPVGSLAIPGYDSLSASQVVQRLAGLSGPELQAVKEYESASRGRRTILARVGQLQGH
ncbi:hypothetical protein K6U06_09930 [Acidiferrimicrobium sp. IK]|uniref:hypothetical protein n=1 Tax=Acidiferrimicrobium sp. IK TaxID=2871700 RepID=UPI0021CB00FF|nr:hypothetical protein [Acidiferrimicrobium sp. IK]MCU4184678.1 hypothetical protein [Acidiferrimicrobium sp. IK]